MRRIMLFFVMLCGLTACSAPDKAERDDRITIRLAAPQNAYIEDFDTNLYKLWLEEQTDLNLEMEWLPAADAEQSVKLALSTGANLPDAYIGFGNHQIFTNPNIQRYGEQGVIIPVDGLIEQYGTNTKKLFAELREYNIEALMTSADGHIYFMPGFSSSTITKYRQLMWINKGWLDALELEVPATTAEFADTLRAFKRLRPDGIPMAGTEDSYSKQPYDFLFDAFIYNDVNNSRLLLEDGVVSFAPVRDEWRDALRYMRGLYDEGLYSPLSFVQDDQQLKQMANDAGDILGVFASPGITMTVQQNSPEMIERYTGVGPLVGPDGIRLSTIFMPDPMPNGVITSACEHPEEVFRLFDLMLSEEACLMGRYGTKGEDWDFAGEGEISIYGTPATIRIINQLWNRSQNKHLCQIGPYVSRPKFSGGVTWGGSTTDGEYMNAQAALLQNGLEPEEYIDTLIYTPDEDARIGSARAEVEAYVRASVIDFITGGREISDDAAWREYLRGFETLGLDEFLTVAQTAWDRRGNNRQIGK